MPGELRSAMGGPHRWPDTIRPQAVSLPHERVFWPLAEEAHAGRA